LYMLTVKSIKSLILLKGPDLIDEFLE
jgi:hypothetical protein